MKSSYFYQPVETVYGDGVHIFVKAERASHVLAGVRCSCEPEVLYVNGRPIVTHKAYRQTSSEGEK